MHITVIMVLTYIVCCLRIGVAPWRYFQLNARYFSDEAGIFSKLSIDRLIPDRWRLSQSVDDGRIEPRCFPVFLKPEWGQNAHGIHRADDAGELARLRARLAGEPQRYLLQEAAPGAREFEIFGIDADRGDQRHDVLTVTEAVNATERFPINSKYNRHTRYVDVSERFDAEERQRLASYLGAIGRFGISRMSVRADSREALLAGDFHVIEINLFLPMPINLLDDRYTWSSRWRFIRRSMMALAQSTRLIEPLPREPAIFTRMMLYGRRGPFGIGMPDVRAFGDRAFGAGVSMEAASEDRAARRSEARHGQTHGTDPRPELRASGPADR